MTDGIIRNANHATAGDAERQVEALANSDAQVATGDDAAPTGGLQLAELSALDPRELALLATLGC